MFINKMKKREYTIELLKKDVLSNSKIDIDDLLFILDKVEPEDYWVIERAFLEYFKDNEYPFFINAFIVLNNITNYSFRSGVWTYYENADADLIRKVSKYFNDRGYKELANYMVSNIHDYHNYKDYPVDWINQSTLFDKWLFENRKIIDIIQYDLLQKYKKSYLDSCSEILK